jgi:hypothetical protein
VAGYIFGLNSLDALNLYVTNGAYATKLSAPVNSRWMTHHEGTFADYATMQEGDNVYFFIQRKIYGIGKIVKVGPDCKFFNYPEAGKPKSLSYSSVRSKLLWDEGEDSVNQRCICLFEPDPYFFKTGIDMDDVLASNPSAFKMLRAFWKLSFIKFDDEENQAFRDVVLKRNQAALSSANKKENILEHHSCHKRIGELVTANYELRTGVASILASCADDSRLAHEMAIEMGLLHQLSYKDEDTCKAFGTWDYLSHQVVASPFKPIDYMDRMDIFGYAYLPKFKPTRAHLLIGEIKKDEAEVENVDQLLKYQ